MNWFISSLIRKYELHSGRELCYSNLKLISDKKDTQIFYAFDIVSHEPVFRVIIGSRIVVPQFLSQNNAPATQTHNLDFDTTCQTMSYSTLPLTNWR